MEESLAARGLYPQTPPAFESRSEINPTLLMSWWATIFSVVIIVVRLCGRYVRIERFFPEDKVMTYSMIPLLIRMILVHYVLVYGTNNVQATSLTAEEISKREIGSKLVLAARIFYAIFIWTAKLAVCEFLKRVTGVVWRQSIATFLRFIHFFLASTLVAVIIATLAECQPFDHYWQVTPDPGPPCRCGYAQLITMGTCDVITDLLLVAFPVPIILMSQMPLKRKLALVILFCLSLALVGITCYRVPSVIKRRGNQPYRSLIASLEILAATAVSNAVVIGSFVRDRGVKKLKYKRDLGFASVNESVDNSHVRRNTVMQHQWGSDCDLAGDLGIRLDPRVYPMASSSSQPPSSGPFPIPPSPLIDAETGSLNRSWSFKQSRLSDDHVSATDSLDTKISPHEYIPTSQSPREKPGSHPSTLSSPRMPLFDVGGLLNNDNERTARQQSNNTSQSTGNFPQPQTPTSAPARARRTFLQDIGALSFSNRLIATDLRASTPRVTANTHNRSRSHNPPPYNTAPDMQSNVEVELHDVGGLLSRNSTPGP
ncbi:hypothetical protein N7478_012760 [Penicillium angulare]|uniref:uncharacterized protein n=1 Tax=Penicillium angulare TaxID=116970 RepID=UPI002541F50F|nr:uncharacterized protein N7478_012760 [Penicillium angulare]KAJ5256656.1 hypothetical protein N7478_012760 [Penicillium angulare]